VEKGIESRPKTADVFPVNGGMESVCCIELLRVENVSGDDSFEFLGHYIELKLSDLLESTGRFDVLRGEAGARDWQCSSLQPDASIQVQILSVESEDSGTLKLGFVSKQKRSVRVNLRTQYLRASGEVDTKESEGIGSKGAWGVIATVDRDRMLNGEAIWKIDQSMLGHACHQALIQTVDFLNAHQTQFKSLKTENEK